MSRSWGGMGWKSTVLHELKTHRVGGSNSSWPAPSIVWFNGWYKSPYHSTYSSAAGSTGLMRESKDLDFFALLKRRLQGDLLITYNCLHWGNGGEETKFSLNMPQDIQIEHQVKIFTGASEAQEQVSQGGYRLSLRFSKQECPSSSGIILAMALLQTKRQTKSLYTNISAVLLVCNYCN